jgi:uncharacterized protein (TIGR02145 family)
MIKSIKISVLVLFVVIVIIACKKENNNPSSSSNGETTAVFNPYKLYGTMTDQDSNVYKTITIGTQTWMAENLRSTKYRNGETIPNITDNVAWVFLTTGAYCSYANTANKDEIATYGRLYNWYAIADSRNIAPIGWHVPSDAEWTTLTTYLDGPYGPSGKMKETGTTHWSAPSDWEIWDAFATNDSGFTALPSGFRYFSDGTFHNLGFTSFWWSSTAFDANNPYNLSLTYNAYNLSLSYNSGFLFRNYVPVQGGFAVRLLKD